MFCKNLNIISILALSSVLLTFSFSTPIWSMNEEPEVEGDSPKVKIRPGFFKYDLSKLDKAKQIIVETDFLPAYIRSIFVRYVEAYDRTQFLKYDDSSAKKAFISTLATSEFPMDPAVCELLPTDLLKSLRKGFKTDIKLQCEPYLRNVEYNIRTKGSFNYALFDSFLYHLLGVGQSWMDEEHSTPNPYSQENVTHLLLKLKEIKFLTDFKMESLSTLEETYSPREQLNFFHQNNTEEITDLVIAGGHVGRKGIESISRYKKTLTVDLSPFELPDVIAAINDPRLLEALLERYESHFTAIYETSNTKGLASGGIIKSEAAACLVRMLKPGGRLSYAPIAYEGSSEIDDITAEYFIKKYDLIPIRSSEDEKMIIALQKKEDNLQ